MSITSKARTGKLLLAMSPALLAGPGCAKGSSDAPSEEDDDGATTPPTGLTAQDIEQATYLDLEPGVPWEMDVGNNAATYGAGLEAAPQMLETISAKSWATIHTGESRTVSFELGSEESLAAYARPYDEAGNVDLELYKQDPVNGSWTFIKHSLNPQGHIDLIFTPPYTSGWEGAYYLKMVCRSDACNSGTYVITGDDADFHTYSVYLNQRSFTAKTNGCTNDAGAWIADGECMCADASAAMGLVAGGKRKISELANVAQDLFDNTNEPNGAANRWALMDRLTSHFGYGECVDLGLDETNIRYRLRYMWLVLLRSPKFSTAGHYVQVRGYTTDEAGVFRVRVNDPYGVWASKNLWDPVNTTSVGHGEDATIPLSKLKSSGASLVVCK